MSLVTSRHVFYSTSCTAFSVQLIWTEKAEKDINNCITNYLHNTRVTTTKAAFIVTPKLNPAALKQESGQDTVLWGFVFQMTIFACHLCLHTNRAISRAFNLIPSRIWLRREQEDLELHLWTWTCAWKWSFPDYTLSPFAKKLNLVLR